MRNAILASFAASSILGACGGLTEPTTAPAATIDAGGALPTTTAAPLTVGTACGEDCAGAGADGGAICMQTSFGVPLPGHYCTARCTANAGCAGGADKVVCGTPRGSEYPGAGDICLQRCDPNAASTGCRAGYVCRVLSQNGKPATESGCWVAPPG